MKFIKKFNESKIDLHDVKKYCNECLAYLIDEGFVVNVTSPGFYYYQIEFIKENKQSFSFDVIKDDFIPFMEAIQNKYEILGLEKTNTYNIVINGIKSSKQYYYMDLIDEKISIDFPIHSIIFRINENPQ
jgi:hypothetical protein